MADLFHPYSIVLVDSFDMYKNAGTAYEELVDSTYLYTAFQASVIAIGDVQKTTPETLQFLKTHLIQQMVIDKIHLIPEEEFETFYSYTEAGGWYEQYFGWLPDPVQQTGLLKCDYWSTKADDKLDYVKEMYSISEDEFREKWGEWRGISAHHPRKSSEVAGADAGHAREGAASAAGRAEEAPRRPTRAKNERSATAVRNSETAESTIVRRGGDELCG